MVETWLSPTRAEQPTNEQRTDCDCVDKDFSTCCA